MLYGIHEHEGRIELNKTLGELKIDDEPPLTETEKTARVIDLLKSRSGVFHTAAYQSARAKSLRPPRGSANRLRKNPLFALRQAQDERTWH